jgi:hypothetical protein
VKESGQRSRGHWTGQSLGGLEQIGDRHTDCRVKKVKALKGKENMRIAGICDSAARVAFCVFFFFNRVLSCLAGQPAG